MLDKNGVEYRVGDTVRILTFNGEPSEPREWTFREETVFLNPEHHEVIRRADGSSPLSSAKGVISELPQQPCGSDPGKTEPTHMHFFDGITETCQHCGASYQSVVESGEVMELSSQFIRPKPSAKSPPEFYADFHRIVTETVAREAPKVKVVTDFTSDRCLAFFSFQGFHGDIDWRLSAPEEIETRVKAVLYCCAEYVAGKALR